MQTVIDLKRGDLPALLEVFTLAVTTLDAIGAQEFSDLSLRVKGVAGRGRSHDLVLDSGQMLVCSSGVPCGVEGTVGIQQLMLAAQVRELLAAWKWSAAKAARYFRCTRPALSELLGSKLGSEMTPQMRSFERRAQALLLIDLLRTCLQGSAQEAACWVSEKRRQLGGKSIEMLAGEQEPLFLERILAWSLGSESTGQALH